MLTMNLDQWLRSSPLSNVKPTTSPWIKLHFVFITKPVICLHQSLCVCISMGRQELGSLSISTLFLRISNKSTQATSSSALLQLVLLHTESWVELFTAFFVFLQVQTNSNHWPEIPLHLCRLH